MILKAYILCGTERLTFTSMGLQALNICFQKWPNCVTMGMVKKCLREKLD
jgi:hypothetical protein